MWRALAFLVKDPLICLPTQEARGTVLGRHEGEGTPASAQTLHFRGGCINTARCRRLPFRFESGSGRVPTSIGAILVKSTTSPASSSGRCSVLRGRRGPAASKSWISPFLPITPTSLVSQGPFRQPRPHFLPLSNAAAGSGCFSTTQAASEEHTGTSACPERNFFPWPPCLVSAGVPLPGRAAYKYTGALYPGTCITCTDYVHTKSTGSQLWSDSVTPVPSNPGRNRPGKFNAR